MGYCCLTRILEPDLRDRARAQNRSPLSVGPVPWPRRRYWASAPQLVELLHDEHADSGAAYVATAFGQSAYPQHPRATCRFVPRLRGPRCLAWTCHCRTIREPRHLRPPMGPEMSRSDPRRAPPPDIRPLLSSCRTALQANALSPRLPAGEHAASIPPHRARPAARR